MACTLLDRSGAVDRCFTPCQRTYPHGCLPHSAQRLTVRRSIPNLSGRFRIVLSTCFPSLNDRSDLYSRHVSFYLSVLYVVREQDN